MEIKSNNNGDKITDKDRRIVIPNVPTKDGRRVDLIILPGENGEPGRVLDRKEHIRPSSKRNY